MKTFFILSLALPCLLLAKPAADRPVKLTYPDYDEAIAMTYLVASVLDAELDQPVELKKQNQSAIYEAIAAGEQDAFVDAWLPHTHEQYWEKHGDNLVDLGPSYSYGVTGLVVPAYTGADSIEDLNEIAEKLDNRIVGVSPDAGVTRNTFRAIEAYNLDLEQVISSAPAMVRALERAIERRQDIVVTGWKPHWMFGRYNLKVLDDPKGIYPIDTCKTVVRKGFENDFPEAAQFLINFNMTEDHLLDLMLRINDSEKEVEEVVKAWKREHRVLIESWLPLPVEAES